MNIAQSKGTDHLDLYNDRFKKLVNQIHSASTPNSIMVGIRNKILDIYNVEMATVFLIDVKKDKLVSWVLMPGEALNKIKLDIDLSSITGFVAKSKRTLNIADAYDHDELKEIHPSLRFDSSWDKKSGMRTKQVLAAPIGHKSNLMGVIQLINKKDGTSFNLVDEQRIKELSTSLGIALYNHYKSGKKIPMRYEELVKRNLISAQEMERAMVMSTQQEKEVEAVLMEYYQIPKAELGQTLATVYKTRFVDLQASSYRADDLIKPETIQTLSQNLIVPLDRRKNELVVAAKDPANQTGLLEVKTLYKASKLSVFLAFGEDIRAILNKFVDHPEVCAVRQY